jgi:hypothetical protein
MKRQHPENEPEHGEGVDAGRRGFLKAAGAAGAGAAAVSAASLAEADVAEAPEEQLKSRYRLTPHIERYYFLNRL